MTNLPKWKKFLISEGNYTSEELARDNLWNDLDQYEIDGFFWNAGGDNTLDFLTDLILGLADAMGRSVGSAEEWKDFRDEVMVDHSDIGHAYEVMAPHVDIPELEIETNPDSPGAEDRQSEKKGKDLKDKAQNLIAQAVGDIKKEFKDVDLDDILELFSDEIEGYGNFGPKNRNLKTTY